MNKKAYIQGFRSVLSWYEKLAETPSVSAKTVGQPKILSLREFQKQKFDPTYIGSPLGSHGDTAYSMALNKAYKAYLAGLSKPQPVSSVTNTPLYYAESPKGPSGQAFLDLSRLLAPEPEERQPRPQEIASVR